MFTGSQRSCASSLALKRERDKSSRAAKVRWNSAGYASRIATFRTMPAAVFTGLIENASSPPGALL